MEPEAILNKAAAALVEFFKHESTLLDITVNERSLTHKLAEYLQLEFPTLNVDCEYNRRDAEPKLVAEPQAAANTLPEPESAQTNDTELPEPESVKTDDRHGKTIYPDIIVHRRRERSNNLLIVEAKKTGNPNVDNDVRKLERLTARDGKYRYVCGLHLIVDCQAHRLGGADVYRAGTLDPALKPVFVEALPARLRPA